MGNKTKFGRKLHGTRSVHFFSHKTGKRITKSFVFFFSALLNASWWNY